MPQRERFLSDHEGVRPGRYHGPRSRRIFAEERFQALKVQAVRTVDRNFSTEDFKRSLSTESDRAACCTWPDADPVNDGRITAPSH
jgi:hypothetical protein